MHHHPLKWIVALLLIWFARRFIRRVIRWVLRAVRGMRRTSRRKERYQERERSHRPEDHSIPRDRVRLTAYVEKELQRLREAKKRGIEREWVEAFGWRIIEVSLNVQDMSVESLFAALFAVNQVFHGSGGAEAAMPKNRIVDAIIAYHRNKVCLLRVTDGEYANTYELSYSLWRTHIPFHVIDKGHVEHPGEPSVRKVQHHSRARGAASASTGPITLARTRRRR